MHSEGPQQSVYPEDVESLTARCKELEDYNLLWQQRADTIEVELSAANDRVKNAEDENSTQRSRIEELEQQLQALQASVRAQNCTSWLSCNVSDSLCGVCCSWRTKD